MTREELLTLRDILTDFRKGNVQLDYVEAHIAEMLDEANAAGYHCSRWQSASECLLSLTSTPQEPAE
jgi:hypothetical protein